MIGGKFPTRGAQSFIEDARIFTQPGMASWAGSDPALRCGGCWHFERNRNRTGWGHCLLFEGIRRAQHIKVNRAKTKLSDNQLGCTKWEARSAT
jgi:hypothetical protein